MRESLRDERGVLGPLQVLLQGVRDGAVVGHTVDGHLVETLHGCQGRANPLRSEAKVYKAIAVLDAQVLTKVDGMVLDI